MNKTHLLQHRSSVLVCHRDHHYVSSMRAPFSNIIYWLLKVFSKHVRLPAVHSHALSLFLPYTKLDDEMPSLSMQLSDLHREFGPRAARPSIFHAKQSIQQSPLPWVSRPANEHRVGYLSLPGEIRNPIMMLALVPGDIYLPPTRYSSNSQSTPWPQLTSDEDYEAASEQSQIIVQSWFNRKPQPSWTLLATCKQIYFEGRSLPYSLNVFHLAPGNLLSSLSRFVKMNPLNFGSIRKVCIDLSFADLDLATIKLVEVECRDTESPALPPNRKKRHIRRHITQKLRNIWASKLAHVRDIKHLDEVTLRFNFPDLQHNRRRWERKRLYCDLLVIKGNDMIKALRGIEPKDTLPPVNAHGSMIWSLRDSYYDGWDRQMKAWFQMAAIRSSALLRDNLPEDGVRAFDPWSQGLVGDRCEVQMEAHGNVGRVWDAELSKLLDWLIQ